MVTLTNISDVVWNLNTNAADESWYTYVLWCIDHESEKSLRAKPYVSRYKWINLQQWHCFLACVFKNSAFFWLMIDNIIHVTIYILYLHTDFEIKSRFWGIFLPVVWQLSPSNLIINDINLEIERHIQVENKNILNPKFWWNVLNEVKILGLIMNTELRFGW